MPTAESNVNPVARRRELAARLRQLRHDAGMSLEAAADRLMISVPKLSRLENAERGIQARDVRDLCELYGVSADEQAELIGAATQASQRGWWQDFRALNESSTFLGLEDAATQVSVFEALRIPGLVQTEAFTRAVLPHLRTPIDAPAEWTEETVRVRGRRQERIASGELHAHFVIDEAALRRPVGGAEVMHGQIQRLLDDGKRSNVTMQVIPFARGPHVGIDGSFQLMSFPAGRIEDVVHIEGLLGRFIRAKESEVEPYRIAFAELSSRVALKPRETVSWLQKFRDEIG